MGAPPFPAAESGPLTLQAEDLTGLVGRGDFPAELLDDAAGAVDKLHVAVGQLALGVHDVVLHADADMAAQGHRAVEHGHGGVPHAEAAPGGAGTGGLHGLLHKDQVLHAAGDAVGAAHAELEVQRPLQHALLQVVLGVVDHAGVKRLDLGLDAPLLHIPAQLLQERGGVDEQAGVQPVHGAAVIGAHLGAQLLQVDLARLVGGVQVAGGGHVQDDVAVGVVGAEQLHRLGKAVLVHGALALVVAHVQVGDRGARLPAGVHILGDLLGRHGDIGVIGLGGPSAGRGDGDDRLAAVHKNTPQFNRFMGSFRNGAAADGTAAQRHPPTRGGSRGGQCG